MGNSNKKYTVEFNQTIVNLYHSGKSYAQIQKEYGISHSSLANWIKQYSEVKIDNDTIMTASEMMFSTVIMVISIKLYLGLF